MTRPKRPAADRFNEKWIPEPNSGCWVWVGGITRTRNYERPMFRFSTSDQMGAARASWLLNRGPIPSGLFVLHKCHNSVCVNPDHLYLGDHDQNMRDKVDAGRWAGGKPPTVPDHVIRSIHRAKGSGSTKQVGARYGVSGSMVWLIWNNKTARYAALAQE